MGMGSLSNHTDDDFNPEINTTPLVDVMLVLLIIFIITIPVINHSVHLDLPRASAQPSNTQPETVHLSIDGVGQRFWNNERVSEEALIAKITEAARRQPQPELQLRAARTTPYETVAQVMAVVQRGGLTKIGFITEPTK